MAGLRKILPGLAISVALLVWIFRELRIETLAECYAGIDVPLLLVSASLFIPMQLFRLGRWVFLTSPLGVVSFPFLSGGMLVCYGMLHFGVVPFHIVSKRWMGVWDHPGMCWILPLIGMAPFGWLVLGNFTLLWVWDVVNFTLLCGCCEAGCDAFISHMVRQVSFSHASHIIFPSWK